MGEAKRKQDAIETGKVEACGNCRFFKPVGYFCRRHSPTAIMIGVQAHPLNPNQHQPVIGSYFPQTGGADSWCGEYEAGVGPSADPPPKPQPIIATAEEIERAVAIATLDAAEVEGSA